MDLISRKTFITGITLSTQCVKGIWLQTCITCIIRITLRALIGRNGQCRLTSLTYIYITSVTRERRDVAQNVYIMHKTNITTLITIMIGSKDAEVIACITCITCITCLTPSTTFI